MIFFGRILQVLRIKFSKPEKISHKFSKREKTTCIFFNRYVTVIRFRAPGAPRSRLSEGHGYSISGRCYVETSYFSVQAGSGGTPVTLIFKVTVIRFRVWGPPGSRLTKVTVKKNASTIYYNSTANAVGG